MILTLAAVIWATVFGGLGEARAVDAGLFPSPAWIKISPAELAKSYDTLFAMSDIHGTLDRLTPLLQSAGLITQASTDDRYTWAGSAASGKRYLLVVVGDLIDKGPDSVRVVQRLKDLQTQAKAKGGRVVVLLGNHDAEFLADPKKCSKEMLSSAQGIDGIQKGAKLSCKDIANSEVGQFLGKLPVGAVIGSWLVVHSGYLDVKAWPRDPAEQNARLKAFFGDIASAYAKGDYATLNQDDRSILSTHGWWKTYYAESRQAIVDLGLNGLVVGHEPDSLDAKGTVAVSRSGWFIKVDAGMNPEADDSKGRILKCKLSALQGADGNFKMIKKGGQCVCTQVGPKNEQDVEIKSEKDDGAPID